MKPAWVEIRAITKHGIKMGLQLHFSRWLEDIVLSSANFFLVFGGNDVLGNDYDPKTSLFNTIYQADQTSPLEWPRELLADHLHKHLQPLYLQPLNPSETDSCVGDYGSEDGSSDTPSWYSFGSNSVSSRNVSTTNYSSFKDNRRYDKEMLITDNICLAYQHGSCSYGEDYHGLHPSEHGGGDVLHYCGLCWSDSPDQPMLWSGLQVQRSPF